MQLVLPAALMACSERSEPEAQYVHGIADILETKDLPPVIKIEDLGPLGFDTTTIYGIEPHFSVLNDALVTLAELKASYDSTPDPDRRNQLNAYAIPFHITADNHHQTILEILEPPLDSVFDEYVESQKEAAGFQDWHPQHREQRSGTQLPGLVPAPRSRP